MGVPEERRPVTPDLDAVRTEIWPGWMRDSKITALCPCQYGLCGACRQGRHDRCLTTQLGGPAPPRGRPARPDPAGHPTAGRGNGHHHATRPRR